MLHRLTISTRRKVEFPDITGEIERLIAGSGVRSGVCHVAVPHTTAGVTVNEHADPEVTADIARRLEELVPPGARWGHNDGNAPAHVKAALIGSSATLFIEDGRLALGTWQGVFLSEFDGPRTRNVLVKIVPDRDGG